MQVRKQAGQGFTLALKPRADVTRIPKQGYQWPPPPKKTCVLQRNAGKLEVFQFLVVITPDIFPAFQSHAASPCLNAVNIALIHYLLVSWWPA